MPPQKPRKFLGFLRFRGQKIIMFGAVIFSLRFLAALDTELP